MAVGRKVQIHTYSTFKLNDTSILDMNVPHEEIFDNHRNYVEASPANNCNGNICMLGLIPRLHGKKMWPGNETGATQLLSVYLVRSVVSAPDGGV